jgi:hypothetical protein
MKDPLGVILTTIRDDTAVAAIVGQRVSTVAEEPPAVRLRAMPTSTAPFGPGSVRLGLQLWRAVAQCYGPDTATGEQTARQLAGAVVDALNGMRIDGSTFIVRAYTPEVSEILRDPDSFWPYHQVRIEAYAATQAVT